MKQKHFPAAASFSDEERAKIVVRCLAGEKEEDLAREIGTTPAVIESWVKKVGDAAQGKKLTEEQQVAEQDIKEQAAELQKTVARLRMQIDQTRRMEETRRLVLEARTSKAIFKK